MSFKKDFVWGLAASCYQFEGAAREDGKGLSVWDMVCSQPGRVHEANTGEVACDFYHRYKEDVKLMADFGVQTYRFGVSWPRVLPEGKGRVNAKGLDFYDKLVDELLAAKIVPWVTLFHWDFPYDLYLQGGWMNPASPDWFAEYTRVVVDKLSDRVEGWLTMNEPQCFIGLGLQTGTQAPGDKHGLREILLAGHHAMIAHGKSVQVIRAHSKKKSLVSWNPCGMTHVPATDSPADIAAAKQAMFAVSDKSHMFNNTWWMDPVYLGHYPEDGLKLFGADAPAFTESEMKTINQPVDFCGVNTYSAFVVRAGADGKPETLPEPPGEALSLNQWKVRPTALYWGPKFFYERYGKTVYLMENGISLPDWVTLDGDVPDPLRIDFLRRFLRELRRAAADGVPIGGYFLWSFFDNFEWTEGYRYRFGLVHVDFQTLKRTPKHSAHWFKKVMETNGESL